MCVPCILSGGGVKTWYNSNRTMHGRLQKKTSGQAPKKLTARQTWVRDNFGFLQYTFSSVLSTASSARSRPQHSWGLRRGRMREERMMMSPVLPPASCPSLPRWPPVTHVTGGPPGQQPVGLGTS